MSELVLANRAADWRRLKMLVLDSVSSPITKRVYNLGLDEFFEWFGKEPRPGFTKATVSAWRVALEARGLGSISINVRITAVRKLAVEAADNGLLAPELAAGITRIKGVKSKGVRVGNWLSIRQAQTLLNTPDVSTNKGLRDRAMLAVLLGMRAATIGGSSAHAEAYSAAGRPLVHRGPPREARPRAHHSDADLGESRDRFVDLGGWFGRGPRIAAGEPHGPSKGANVREGSVATPPAVRDGRRRARHRAA
jgi:Phage integrase, N-terminal SAM-like domain